MSKNNRITKAHGIVKANLTRVLDRTFSGKPKTIYVPGSDGKGYNVILKRKGSKIKTTCLLQTGIGSTNCKGNYKVPCYHSIAAVITAVSEAGMHVAICSHISGAEHINRLRGGGGKLLQLAGEGKKNLWMVVK